MKPRRGHQHPGCEFLYLLEGGLEILHGEATHRLEAGDAVYFDSNTPHSYSCEGDASAKALIVTLQSQHGAVQPGNGAQRPRAATPVATNGNAAEARSTAPVAGIPGRPSLRTQ